MVWLRLLSQIALKDTKQQLYDTHNKKIMPYKKIYIYTYKHVYKYNDTLILQYNTIYNIYYDIPTTTTTTLLLDNILEHVNIVAYLR